MTEKKIKVLFIAKWFMNRNDPQLGVFIRKHASPAALYCDVALLCVMPDTSQKDLIETEDKTEYGVACKLVYYRQSKFRLINFFRYLKAMRHGLNQYERSFGRHDVTQAYILLRPAWVAYWLKLTKGIPFIISEQWSGYATGKFAAKNFFEKSLSRWVFRKAAGVTAVSEFLKKRMQACSLNNNYIITPNVIELHPKGDAPFPSTSKIKVLSVADLDDRIKNISGTIRAISRIAGIRNDFEFHLVGHGKDEASLRKLASDAGLLDRIIFFHGVKTNEEVFQFLHASNFLIVNSRFETFSLICVEALACGKPVIATRCGGPQEFITPERGMLVDVDAQDQLEHALAEMLNGFRKFDSDKLRRYAVTTFAPESIGRKFFNLYAEIRH